MLALALFAVLASGLLAGCGGKDRQEEAVNDLYEAEYAFTVEEFFRAAHAGDLKAVRWFIGAGMDPAVADVSKTQALHMATEGGQAAVVEELLGLGVDPTAVRLDGRTPLMLAAEAGDGRSVEMLIDAGSPVLGKDSKGWSALALAAYGGFSRAVEALVPLSRPHLNDALLLAAIGGHVGAIDHLLSGSAEVDVRSPERRTPLMLAAARGHDDAVSILLHHGANWYATDVESNTAAQMAAAGGHGSVVNLLETAHLDDAERGAGDASFVPEVPAGEEWLYSSQTRRIDNVSLVGGVGEYGELGQLLRLLSYRERQLPIQFDGEVDEAGPQRRGAAPVRRARDFPGGARRHDPEHAPRGDGDRGALVRRQGAGG